jgi:uncharacterized membrane protein (DUF4010 family)
MTEIPELLSRFAVALGIGLLIGLERGWRRREEKPGRRAAGIRTFAISALLGGLVGALAREAGAGSVGGALILGLGFAAFAGVFVLFARDENRATQSASATTAIAGLATFALGAYAVAGDMRIAAAVAVAAAGLLAVREDLHGFVAQITWPELRSGLVLLAMTFVVLPIVPDDAVGPFGGVNPREVWLIAIVLAAVSFLGYAAVKYFGARHGVLLAAAAGGLVSSTAVTVANANRAAAGEGSPTVLAAGVAVAAAVSFLRVATIAAVLKPVLLPLLAPPLVAAAIVALGFAVVSVYWRDRKRSRQTDVTFRNPFSFWSVIALALSIGVIMLLGRALSDALGSAGAIAGAAAIGLFDVDAVTVSMARLAPQPLGVTQASLAILAAVASNTLSKIAIGAGIGRGLFALEVTAMAIACALVGTAAFWLAWMAGIGAQ